VDVGYVVFRRGDVMTEWFYSDRWYNIFRIEDVEDGRLKGWYCNITRPAHITADVIAAADLALDVFVTPTGNFYLLDEDEFEALDLSMDERMSVVNAVDSLRRLVGTRAAPFNEILRQTKPLA
jgi:protein associated with RNAse G/E